MSWVLFALALVAFVLIAALSAGPTATAASGDRQQQSFCEIHRGKPAWDRICEETRRR
jgi:hypothetical protein